MRTVENNMDDNNSIEITKSPTTPKLSENNVLFMKI